MKSGQKTPLSGCLDLRKDEAGVGGCEELNLFILSMDSSCECIEPTSAAMV